VAAPAPLGAPALEATASAAGGRRIAGDLVRLDAVVTGGDGRQVTDLGPDDFEVLENGQPRTVADVRYVRADGPRSVVFMIDDLGLSFASMARVKDGLHRLVEQGLGADDRVAVVDTTQADRGFALTGDRLRLLASIDRLQYRLWQRGAASGPAFRSERMGERTLSALETVVRTLAARPGRTAVIVISDQLSLAARTGLVDPILLDGVQRISDAAARAQAVIYGVRPQDVPYLHAGDAAGLDREVARRRRDLDRYGSSDFHGVARLSDATGGLFLGLGGELDVAFALAGEEQQAYYVVSYRPGPDAFRPQRGFRPYNQVRVRLTRGHLHVRSQTGFYGATDDEMTAGTGAPVTPAS
jgi:VWFA-related protein